jgi:V/A-type H+-transporting ATPase subunit E
MGHGELIESLYKECANKIQHLWKEIEIEAEKIRAEKSGRLDQMRAEYSVTLRKEVKSQEEKVLAKAGIEVRKIKLLAERALSDRLYPLALSLLHKLKNERYNIEFESLVKELPAVQWEEVRINPEDGKIAKAHFVDSRITPDNSITGGIEVRRKEGRIRINNTFEKRLERAWEDLLPLLIKDIYNEVSVYGNSS